MNGAQSLVATLVDQGVDICFANPGTSEMHFLAALENPKMRSVLCLFEGVATGAADGWYRMKDTPASTLLHLGPGLANGLANIHNAKRASSGMVNIIGEHSTSHLKYNPPLTSDIEGLARPLSHWIRRADSADTIAWDTATAVAKASEHPGKIATLILPGDTSWQQATAALTPPRMVAARKAPNPARIEHVAKVLRSGEPTLIILGNRATRGAALERAGKVAAATGARLGSQFFTARIERGAGRVPIERIPYAVPLAQAFLKDFRHIVTVETQEPVAFFAYPDKPSLLKAEGTLVHTLVEADEDSALAFEMLLDALNARSVRPVLQARVETPVPEGALTPLSIAHALSAALPENAIVVDESLTTGRETMGHTMGAAPHDLINNMGGSIGYATPVATGAALACPERRVICMVGDGSAMYTIQSLWTQARENLNVTTIIFANNSYAILKAEYANMGAGTPGERALSMIDIDRPRIDWLAMAKSMGVPGVGVDTAQAFYQALVDATREPGPRLIEVRL
ncbi:acetolactate synthase large subunit [Burkholderia multivorans]|uniref:Acetolactate synthase large subunit n=1 Tax=Burkholderia multivorans TaxID=87883 RepID=A0AB37AR61_9BURK|nr:acetolactate synthase large subunit [Burkholderia multivorans]MBU9220206.1 acetolactate synthase large subunit [Burkholderia multivorans]MBU9400147.1 acetolactate synthase large subunit [Burkholderia multivorans]MBU9417879.1 acetolactate synthase large subunit [Burkholderia multivorans]MBU9477763.1 acetolactate synthase large subunit [Burkholderia multivorans]MDN8045750.1 acetolactate synthase large subunit [Burkholderia multivorans]